VRLQSVALLALTLGLALFGAQDQALAGFLAPARSDGAAISTLFHDDVNAEGGVSGGASRGEDANPPARGSQGNDQLANLYRWLLPSFAANQFEQTRGGCGEPSSGSYSGGSSQPAGCAGRLLVPKVERTGLLFLKAMVYCLPPFVDPPFHPPRSR
jgi:hypothetical protein